ncbi:hypothetical protein C1646_759448 [Rhizophagus diaphanus]|nr:hypothetical protein C1646_759448 [Rhizophagus diaphanus] [Rhizophagus sp. MUCL 43196]
MSSCKTKNTPWASQKNLEAINEIKGGQPDVEYPVKKRRIERGWKSYTVSDGNSVELPPQIIDMLENDKFVPEPYFFPKILLKMSLSFNYKLSVENLDGTFPKVSSTREEKYKEALRKLFDELGTRVATTSVDYPKSWSQSECMGVTDAEKWYFMECTLENERKPVFKLSKPLIVAYEDEGMKDMAEKVLGYILWLLEEAQKTVKALEESREIKGTQSINSLRELNAKLLVEIAELRKKFAEIEGENAEIPELRKRVEELEQKNTKLEARFAILEKGSLAELRFAEQTVSDVDLSSSVIDQRNNDDVKTSAEKEMDAFLVEAPPVKEPSTIISPVKLSHSFEAIASAKDNSTAGGNYTVIYHASEDTTLSMESVYEEPQIFDPVPVTLMWVGSRDDSSSDGITICDQPPTLPDYDLEVVIYGSWWFCPESSLCQPQKGLLSLAFTNVISFNEKKSNLVKEFWKNTISSQKRQITAISERTALMTESYEENFTKHLENSDTGADDDRKCKREQDNEDEIEQQKYEQDPESNDDSSDDSTDDSSYEIQKPYSPEDPFPEATEDENGVITNVPLRFYTIGEFGIRFNISEKFAGKNIHIRILFY